MRRSLRRRHGEVMFTRPGHPRIPGLEVACVFLTVVAAAIALRGRDRGSPAEVVPPGPAGPVIVAGNASGRLTLSGDDLYWTTGGRFAGVYRTSLAGTRTAPTLLESGAGRPRTAFGAVATTGAGRDYVVVNDAATGTSRIRRLPGADGPAATIAVSPGWAGNSDLLTDGVRLYWTAAAGVRSVPVTGGPVQTLATGATIGDLGLDTDRIYYAAGHAVRSVAKTGGTPRTEVPTTRAVVSLHVQASSRPVVSWAEADGAIRTRTAGSAVVEYRAAVPRRHPVDVVYDGRRMLWSDCADSRCRMYAYADGVMATVDLDAVPHDLASDGQTTYFICAGQLLQYQAPTRGHIRHTNHFTG
jgi:hypothetical protein